MVNCDLPHPPAGNGGTGDGTDAGVVGLAVGAG